MNLTEAIKKAYSIGHCSVRELCLVPQSIKGVQEEFHGCFITLHPDPTVPVTVYQLFYRANIPCHEAIRSVVFFSPTTLIGEWSVWTWEELCAADLRQRKKSGSSNDLNEEKGKG